MAQPLEKAWSLYRRPLQAAKLHEINPYGILIVLAALAGCFDLIQRNLDKHGMALYLPDFSEQGGKYDIDPSGYFPPANPTTDNGLLRVPNRGLEALYGPPGSKLPPPPTTAPAPPAQPMGGGSEPPQYTITPGLLRRIIQQGGGLGEDGCLAQPLQSAQAFVYPPPPGTTTAIAQIEGTAQVVVFRFEADQVTCIQEAKG